MPSLHIETPVDIILNVPVADGVGDYIHGISIAQWLKRHFPALRIAFFSDCLGKVQIAAMEDKMRSSGELDELFAVYITTGNYEYEGPKQDLTSFGFSGVEELADEFTTQHADRILMRLDISYTENCSSVSEEFPHFQLEEHGGGSLNDTCLGMGVGIGRIGLRLNEDAMRFCRMTEDEKGEQRQKFWQQLSEECPQFTEQLMRGISGNYHGERYLLPANCRSGRNLVNFLCFNRGCYGEQSDFYVDKKLLADTSVLAYLQSGEHGFWEIVTPDGIKVYPEGAEPQSLPGKRIFAGYLLSNEVYKGLYFYNRGACAAAGGDDTTCTVFSSDNLLWPDSTNVMQKSSLRFMQDLVVELDLKNLSKYFSLLQIESIRIEEFTILARDIESIKAEWFLFRDFVQENLNLFDFLSDIVRVMQIAHDNPKQPVGHGMDVPKPPVSNYSRQPQSTSTLYNFVAQIYFRQFHEKKAQQLSQAIKIFTHDRRELTQGTARPQTNAR